VTFGALGLWFAVHHFYEKWKPPVREHQPALLDTASQSLSCAPANLVVTEEAPRRARIDGCGKTKYFMWMSRGRRRPTWQEIDPNCTVELYGFKVSCY
jgi:hypothetical protein